MHRLFGLCPLLRDFINDGDYWLYYAGISANLKLFCNDLQLYANLTQNVYGITGDYSDSFTIIGTYGTGKSSFILAFEQDLKSNSKHLIQDKTHMKYFTNDFYSMSSNAML